MKKASDMSFISVDIMFTGKKKLRMNLFVIGSWKVLGAC